MIDGAAYSAAGVRKPPREETAHGELQWRGKRYGDFSAAVGLADGIRTGAASGTTQALSWNVWWAASNAIDGRGMGNDQ